MAFLDQAGFVSFSPLLVGVLSETKKPATAEGKEKPFSPLLVGVLSET